MDNFRPQMEYLVQGDNRLFFYLHPVGRDPNPVSAQYNQVAVPVLDFSNWTDLTNGLHCVDNEFDLYADSSSTEEDVSCPQNSVEMTEECGFHNYVNASFSRQTDETQSLSFYSCEEFSDEGHTPSSSASQEQIPEEFYQKPVTLDVLQKEPDQVVSGVLKMRRMPRSLRRTVEINEKKRAGFACIKEVLIDDNYDYMLPPLPSGYKKKNQGCGWSRELRPNDKYEYGFSNGKRSSGKRVLNT
jgi:hypothetical protein